MEDCHAIDQTAGSRGHMTRQRDTPKGARWFRTLGLAGAALYSTAAAAWQVHLQGTASPAGVAVAVGIDASGNVLAGGRVINEGAGQDFSVVKVAGDSGAVMWRTDVDGDLNDSDELRAIALDAAGDVVAAGNTTRQLIDGLVPDSDFTIIKFAGASGDILWRQDINGTDHFPIDSAEAVAVDRSGDVIAAGRTWNLHGNAPPGSFGGRDFTVVKLAGTSGEVVWQRDIDGTHAIPSDAACAVAVDAAGDVAASGTVRGVDTDSDFAVVKFSGVDGAELWRYTASGAGLDVGGADEGQLVRFDATGNVVAAGILENADTGRDVLIVKLSADTGDELWRRLLNGAANGADRISSMALDSSGNVLVTLKLDSGSTRNGFVVLKLAGGDGADLWRWEPAGRDFPAADSPFGVALDSVDDVFVVGQVYRSLLVSSFVLFKLSGRTGDQLWSSEVQGLRDEGGLHAGYAVAVDAVDDVIAAGTIDGTAGDYFAVLKRRGADGTDFGVTATVTPARPTSTATPSPPPTPNVDDVVFDVKVDRFEGTGNIFGPSGFADDFDGNSLGSTWGAYFGTASESDGFLHLTSPGTIYPYPPNPSVALVQTAVIGPVALKGLGDFVARSIWEASVLVLNNYQYFAIGNGTSFANQEAVAVGVWNLDAATALALGEPGAGFAANQTHAYIAGGTFVTRDTTTVLLDPSALTGPIVLQIAYNEAANQVITSFSLDGGATFQSPFPANGLPTYNSGVSFALVTDPVILAVPPPTETPSPSPTAIRTAAACVGDCDGNGEATVDEVVTGVNIALGAAQLAECPAFDCNGNNAVTVNCLVEAVNAVLAGCLAHPSR
jgi:hypothetical protein